MLLVAASLAPWPVIAPAHATRINSSGSWSSTVVALPNAMYLLGSPCFRAYAAMLGMHCGSSHQSVTNVNKMQCTNKPVIT
eukprot:1455615-Amphidinium_carterae.4